MCLAKKGYKCKICQFDFREVYGAIGKQYIEVHHITPVSMLGPGYVIDIDKDLIPVCANCHAMLHKKYPPYLPDELIDIMASTKVKQDTDSLCGDKNILMAITYPNQIEKTIESGKIAIGVKSDFLETFNYKSTKYVLLHNWQNQNAYLFKLIKEPTLVDKSSLPPSYFLKYKNSTLFLLLDIDNNSNLYKSDYDILHLQPSNRKYRYDLRIASLEELLEPDV